MGLPFFFKKYKSRWINKFKMWNSIKCFILSVIFYVFMMSSIFFDALYCMSNTYIDNYNYSNDMKSLRSQN